MIFGNVFCLTFCSLSFSCFQNAQTFGFPELGTETKKVREKNQAVLVKCSKGKLAKHGEGKEEICCVTEYVP